MIYKLIETSASLISLISNFRITSKNTLYTIYAYFITRYYSYSYAIELDEI